jgi:hypothetical protein
MGLKNLSIQKGATGLTVTAGTAFVFSDDGVTIPNGVHLTVPATADFRLRESVTARYRPSTLSVTGEYSKDKKSVSFTTPKLLANGKYVNNVIRIEREVHPEMSAADAVDLNRMAAQLLFDTDTDNFWAAGSLS